jgi:peptidoglycan/xylan/chitin deacetylase (PgdA/CDA1 family)
MTRVEDAADRIVPPPPQTTPGRVAITLDDLPYVMPSRTTPENGLRYVTQINETLQKHGITALGFAVGGQITPDAIPALQAFVDAGHRVGNHSWSHADYGQQTIEVFRAETRRTDQALSDWMTGPRYYRFPFLREGETEEAKAAATGVLDMLGYQNVPVTIDNDERAFNAEYMAALDQGDPSEVARIADQYIAHMQERTAFFQTLAQERLDRDVAHILLLHLNRINADHLGRLLEWYVSENWQFISIEEALSDTLFLAPDRYAGPRGLSQIERVLGHVGP